MEAWPPHNPHATPHPSAASLAGKAALYSPNEQLQPRILQLLPFVHSMRTKNSFVVEDILQLKFRLLVPNFRLVLPSDVAKMVFPSWIEVSQ